MEKGNMATKSLGHKVLFFPTKDWWWIGWVQSAAVQSAAQAEVSMILRRSARPLYSQVLD